MPFYANTPESRLGRSDSKNPSTTCRGITSSGRPCRRPIAATETSPSSYLKPIRDDDPTDENLYCWQHKDQASVSAKSSPGPRMSHTPILEERTSIDTLAERLGLMRTQTTLTPDIGSLANRAVYVPDPQDATPETASKLLAELAKPVSQQDEPGYIYIFWLTPDDVLESFARSTTEPTDDTTSETKKTKKILLKIGRATGVQRRLNEWQRQCGYNLSLIRYYPYVPSSSPGAVVARKIPHSHKVERLVHIELAGRG
ncbi:hypothetical protein N0V88_002153 [Collariella sp. IMI 366227]|nr:hypothetical protein N0V88_002153 [Collariella sp. IMI 366227]